MAAHPDIQSEQAHFDRAYARLDEMRATLKARHDEVIANGAGGTFQAREERDVIVRSSLARLEQLKLGDEALCFGRIDRRQGERYYIGRLAVSDRDQEPLVVDWRAPVAEPFYRATGRHPMGLVRRRHFITDGPRIAGIEDELLDVNVLDEAGDGAAGGITLVGEGALLASLERSRSGTMRDIVATIQGEQDEIIRADMGGVLVVQGGPGTGKTAVALHRAAYLLYTFRFPLERQGVLVVGPNPLFLRYIEHVLPSLGETGVHLSTITGLYPGLALAHGRAKGVDGPLAARVKGDVRMAKVIAKAVRDRQRPLRRDAVIPYGAFRLRLTVRASEDIVATVKRRPGPHNARRQQVEHLALRRLYAEYEEAIERAIRTGVRAAAASSEGGTASSEFDDFAAEVRHAPEFRDAADRMWPVLLPEELLHDLLGAPPLVDLAARKYLNDSERSALARARSHTLEEIRWTPADIALLDEALVLLGSRKKKQGEEGPLRTFGHVVVDEAQDLSPMQLRMLARRSLGSMTVVGDVGQATGTWSPGSWADVLRHLPARKPPRMVELTVNYRTPAEIMEVANRVLAAAAPHLKPPVSVRSGGEPPSVRTVASEEGLLEVAAGVADELQAEIGGLVAVICPDSMAGGNDDLSLSDPVSVIPVGSVKGLEFDGVVLVEPDRIAEESPQGLRALYVALTRATKRLVVVHARPLPAVLGLPTASATAGV